MSNSKQRLPPCEVCISLEEIAKDRGIKLPRKKIDDCNTIEEIIEAANFGKALNEFAKGALLEYWEALTLARKIERVKI